MVAVLVAGIAVVVMACAELLHARRCRRLAPLAFGPARRPALWVYTVPLLRSAAVGGLAWGLVTLMLITPKVHYRDKPISVKDYRHLLLVLDVSPSMRLEDSGPSALQSRLKRTSDLLDSFFKRVNIEEFRVTVVAVYNGAKPVVVDTKDVEIVRNILNDLPMHFAFQAGKTKLLDGLHEAARIAKPWKPGSTTMVLISDGDTVPPTGMPRMPASISNVLVVGVGDARSGSFIDGRQSRQDVATLRQIAIRLNGIFHNGNENHISTTVIKRMSDSSGKSPLEQLTRREYALIACAAGALILTLLPLFLHFAGTRWRPGAVPDWRVAAANEVALADSANRF